MVMVDSSVWIDYFNGILSRETDLLDSLLQNEFVLTGDIIVTEVLQGFRRDKDYKTARRILLSLPFREMWGRSIGLKTAENSRLLHRKGIMVRKTIDLVIATFCVENKITLLHNDRDFENMQPHLQLMML